MHSQAEREHGLAHLWPVGAAPTGQGTHQFPSRVMRLEQLAQELQRLPAWDRNGPALHMILLQAVDQPCGQEVLRQRRVREPERSPLSRIMTNQEGGGVQIVGQYLGVLPGILKLQVLRLDEVCEPALQNADVG